MAEQLDLSINIGANTQDFQGALQKAQNLLNQFQAALKKATNVGEINYLNSQIKNLNTTIGNIQTQMGSAAKGTANATQSLINFSRIAQDAPFGIIGIANNLNPMLESFQQLAKTEGGTKKALTAMIDGLAGPAGLGVVLGVTSSLLVTFSKQIGNAFKGGEDKLKGLREELKKLNEDVYKIVGAAQSSQTLGTILVGKATNTNIDLKTRQNALKEFKKLYAESAEVQDLDVKNLNSYNQRYLQSINNRAAVQQEGLGKEKNYVNALTEANAKFKQLLQERDKAVANTLATTKDLEEGRTTKQLQAAVKAQYVKPLADAKLEIEKAKASLGRTVDNLLQFSTPDKKDKTTQDTLKDFSQNLKSENNAILQAIQRRKELLKEIGSPILMQKPEDKAKAEKQRLAGIKAFGEYSMTGEFGKSLQGKTSGFYEEQKKINEEKAKDILLTQQQTDANLQLADTLSNYAANSFMNLFNSMQQGMSLGEALGNMFMDLAKQIAAAAIKAAAFQAILSLLPGGAGAKLASGGFGSIFKSILGLASGGVVNGPTLAMIGEGSESEAVMPLSKLGSMMQNTFNAGAMASNGGGGNGEFVLRGQDLVLAMNRSETSLKYRRG
jgi:hypothetical protein